MPTKILIVDDHPLVRELLAEIVEEAVACTKVLQADNLSSTLQVLADEGPFDLITLDLELPDATGFLALLEVRAHAPSAKILVLTGHDGSCAVQTAFLLGADGFISKSNNGGDIASAIVQLAGMQGDRKFARAAIARTCNGLVLPAADQETLTKQQARIVRMLCRGDMNKILAYKLGVSESTAKSHVSAVMRKFGVMSRTQLILEVINPLEKERV